MTINDRVRALIGQCRLYLKLGYRQVALACFLELERLLPKVEGAREYLSLAIQAQRLERYVLLPEVP
jgi:hypothetical protein